MSTTILTDIIISFIGSLLAFALAGFVWILKIAYEQHKQIVITLAKFERFFVLNYKILHDNFDEVKNWISLINETPQLRFHYHFDNFYTDDDEATKLNNQKLIQTIMSTSYKLRRAELDLANLYNGHREEIDRLSTIPNEDDKSERLILITQQSQSTLEIIKQNYNTLNNDVLLVIASIRDAYRVRKYSIFFLISRLFIDVFPKSTERSLARELAALKIDINK